MAREKYSINGQAGKEKLLEYAAGLFGDSPENLKSLMESICQQILEAEIALCLALMETVIQGVTTRRVKNITQILCDTDFSAGTLSNLCKTMDEELEKFRNRDLSGASYPYLVVDARYEKVREGWSGYHPGGLNHRRC